jgi:ADP-ribose pyrophosphatase
VNGEPPERRVIFRGRKVDLALQAVRLADGRTAEREVVLHRGAVALLVEVDADRLCLVRNERYAVGAMLLEVPAGTIDPGESPEETARRELTEETGYRARRVEPLGSWWVSPGVLSERMYLFRCTELEPGPPTHQPDERIEPFLTTWDEALAMVRDGRIDDAKTMLALLIGDRRRRAAGTPPPR